MTWHVGTGLLPVKFAKMATCLYKLHQSFSAHTSSIAPYVTDLIMEKQGRVHCRIVARDSKIGRNTELHLQVGFRHENQHLRTKQLLQMSGASECCTQSYDRPTPGNPCPECVGHHAPARYRPIGGFNDNKLNVFPIFPHSWLRNSPNRSTSGFAELIEAEGTSSSWHVPGRRQITGNGNWEAPQMIGRFHWFRLVPLGANWFNQLVVCSRIYHSSFQKVWRKSYPPAPPCGPSLRLISVF